MIQVIIIAAVFLAMIAALVFVTRWGMRAKDSQVAAVDMLAKTREELGTARNENESMAFEIRALRAAVTESERRVELLSKELADAMERVSLGAGLDAADVRNRVLRAAEAARARSAGQVPAKPGATVPDKEAASGGDPPAVHDLKPIDVLL